MKKVKVQTPSGMVELTGHTDLPSYCPPPRAATTITYADMVAAGGTFTIGKPDGTGDVLATDATFTITPSGRVNVKAAYKP